MQYQGQPYSVFQVYCSYRACTIVLSRTAILSLPGICSYREHVLLGTAILSLSGTYRIVIEHVLSGKVILRLPGIVIEHVLSGTAIHRLPGIVK